MLCGILLGLIPISKLMEPRTEKNLCPGGGGPEEIFMVIVFRTEIIFQGVVFRIQLLVLSMRIGKIYYTAL